MSKVGKTVPWIKLKGLIAAPSTPFTKNGKSLDLSMIGAYVDKLISDGVKNVYVTGTTGEAYSLSVEERKKVCEEWVKCGKNKLDVIILQVGTGSLNTTQELARHAEEKGVDAIAAIPTVPLLPNSIDDVVEYLKRVGDAAPKTPLFYYHFPKLTNVTFSGVTLLDAIQDKVPTFHGMKFTSNDLYDFARCMDHPTGGKYQVFSSYDQLLLPSLALGGEAFVGCHYNFIGRHGNRILEAYKNGDMKTAQKLQYQTNKLANLMDKYGHPGISKYLLTMVGFDFGPPRYPSQIMNEDQITELRKELDAIGFSDMQK